MKLFEGNSFTEFRERMENRDVEVVEAIYDSIQKGYSRNANQVTAFEFRETESDSIYGFSLSRDQWVIALSTCLEVYAEQELYEDCIKIRNLINELSYENGKKGYNKKKRNTDI